MRTRIGIMMVCMLLTMIATTPRLFAEVPNKSPEKLKQMATHIVTGEVLRIYRRTEGKSTPRFDRHLAEVRVKAVEQGSGVETGSLIYVRYFTKHNAPGVTDTAGHRDLPAEGDSVRIHLARNAADGYNQAANNNDGGFNVLFPNGFEKLAPERKD